MARYIVNRILSGLLTLAIMFVAIGFSELQGVLAWNVLIAGAGAISLFCAGFYMVSLGLKDVAYRGGEQRRSARPRLGAPSRVADSISHLRLVLEPNRSGMLAHPTPVIVPDTDEDLGLDEPWQVVVWNDPVNTMTYVVYVFRKLFGYDEPKATELMLQVHHEGRATVTDGPREQAELDCFRLQNHGLWATIEQ